MKTIPIIILTTIILLGCAVKKDMYPSGGSKADGTITMTYNYGVFENPQIDMNQAKGLAAEKCRLWGYKDAKQFGGQKSKAMEYSVIVDIEFQCIN